MKAQTYHQQSNKRARALGAVTCLVALVLSTACGSKASNDPGSETHWFIDGGSVFTEPNDASAPSDPAARSPQSHALNADKDSTAHDTGETAQAPPTLCDGSSQLRFIYNVYGGGPIPFAYEFYSLYGREMLTIDGRCNYYSTRHPHNQVRTGQLHPDAAQRFAARVGYGTFSAHVGDTVPCPDAGPQLLWGPQGSFRCYCDCGTGQPLLNTARGFNADAFSDGSPLTGPVETIMFTRVNDWGNSLPWPLNSLPPLAIEGWASATQLEEAVVLVTDPTEAAALRSLQREWALLREGSAPDDISVDYRATDAGSVEEYSVYLRDPLPERVLDALMEARGQH